MVIKTLLKKAAAQPRRLLKGNTRDKGVQTDTLIFVAPPQIVPVAYNETQMILQNTGRVLALLEVGQTGNDDSVIGLLKDTRRRLQSDGVIMAKLVGWAAAAWRPLTQRQRRPRAAARRPLRQRQRRPLAAAWRPRRQRC